MFSGVIGLIGAALCIGVASAFEDGKALRFWTCLIGALACFSFAIMTIDITPDFLLQECERFSRFADTC